MISVSCSRRMPRRSATAMERSFCGWIRLISRLFRAGEGVGDDQLRRLGGVAAAPKLAAERPADFPARPAFRLPAADPAGQKAGRTFFHGPQAEAPQLPVAQDKCHVPPRFVAGERIARAQVAHDLRITAHRGIGIEVRFAKHPQQQASGAKRDMRRTRAPR